MMTHEELARGIAEVSSLTGEFTLRSGQVSTLYFDKYQFEGRPDLLRPLAQAMVALLPPETEILAGLELGGVPIATAMSLETGLPAVFVRKEAKTYGTCKALEGADVAGKRVTFIEDVITTGGAVADAHAMALAEGADVLAVVCAIWRGEGTPQIARVPDLRVMPALTRADLEGAS